MKKLSTLLLLFFIAVLSFGQDIEFAPKQKLFELPTSGLFALAYIPMDYNQDGITDYIGRDNDDGLIVQLGTENGFEVSDDITVEAFPYAQILTAMVIKIYSLFSALVLSRTIYRSTFMMEWILKK